MLGLNYRPGYGFENNKAYYGPRGLYAGLSPSAGPAHRLGRDSIHPNKYKNPKLNKKTKINPIID